LQAILWAGVTERHLNGHFTVVLALRLLVCASSNSSVKV
jgi:hypothetical protein